MEKPSAKLELVAFADDLERQPSLKIEYMGVF